MEDKRNLTKTLLTQALRFNKMLAHTQETDLTEPPYYIQNCVKRLPSSFHLNGHKSYNHLAEHNKQHHMKTLLKSFHLNGHTLGYHPQT